MVALLKMGSDDLIAHATKERGRNSCDFQLPP